MASNAVVAKNGPLSMMEKLSPIAYLYKPATSARERPASASASASEVPPPPPPEIIVLATWMGAQPVHIAKYVVQYQAIYPTAQILLIRCELSHFSFPSRIGPLVRPAVAAIRAALAGDGGDDDDETAGPTRPRLLVHLFSNGGSRMLQKLYGAWRADSPAAGPLPAHATIFDSSPARFAYWAGIRAYGAGLPRWARLLAAPFLHALSLAYLLVITLGGPGADPLHRLALAHNDTAEVRETRRTYIYSDGDELVPWTEVERHAREAEDKGFAVRREKFGNSPHVAHMRHDPERYWRVVRETWEG